VQHAPVGECVCEARKNVTRWQRSLSCVPLARRMAAPSGLYASLGNLIDEALRDGTPATNTAGGVPRAPASSNQARHDDASSSVDPLQEAEDAATAVFAASCAIAFCYFAARGLFTLGLLGVLGWAFLTNPARDPGLRTACWEPLLAARQVLHGEKLEEKLKRGRLFSALKSAVMGTTSLLRGKRVLVDLLVRGRTERTLPMRVAVMTVNVVPRLTTQFPPAVLLHRVRGEQLQAGPGPVHGGRLRGVVHRPIKGSAQLRRKLRRRASSGAAIQHMRCDSIHSSCSTVLNAPK
jgi:hypothetical protein